MARTGGPRGTQGGQERGSQGSLGSPGPLVPPGPPCPGSGVVYKSDAPIKPGLILSSLKKVETV